MYKVFINDKPLIFCSNSFDLSCLSDFVLIENANGISFKDFINILKNDNKTDSFVLMHENYLEAFQDFFRFFKRIDAAGGVVENKKGQILLIYRNGCWDLPKGKLEKGEDVQEAAIREVEEECGLVGPKITGEFSSTYHTYERDGMKYLKKTYWYAMSYDKEHVLVPQFEEGITKVEWVNKNDLQTYIVDTYGSIKSVINEF